MIIIIIINLSSTIAAHLTANQMTSTLPTAEDMTLIKTTVISKIVCLSIPITCHLTDATVKSTEAVILNTVLQCSGLWSSHSGDRNGIWLVEDSLVTVCKSPIMQMENSNGRQIF